MFLVLSDLIWKLAIALSWKNLIYIFSFSKTKRNETGISYGKKLNPGVFPQLGFQNSGASLALTKLI